ncbi:sulfurtransferase TusA family protein [Paenisporosarcina macmurdoensis]|uniref:Sulfurtransferase TusA family protein n=1 Tax=Paenisporosarcina macmurdoensis TaxID=212659 RepID=A0ABW1L4J4_9BACL
MNDIKVNEILDAKGLACPMPIVKTKKAMNRLEAGQVLEVLATDKGSKADIKAWAGSTGHQYLGTLEEGGVLKHYLRKSSGADTVERNHPNVVTNEVLDQKLKETNDLVIVDVRESAEYAFDHIPNAISIPLGELESRLNELDKDNAIYVVCRTGNRSDFASQKLAENGFTNVMNVVPGMSQWTGETKSITN